MALVIAAGTIAAFPLDGVLGIGSATINPLRSPASTTDLIAQALHIWWIVLLVDVVWTLAQLFKRR